MLIVIQLIGMIGGYKLNKAQHTVLIFVHHRNTFRIVILHYKINGPYML